MSYWGGARGSIAARRRWHACLPIMASSKIRCCLASAPGAQRDLPVSFPGTVTALGSVQPPHKHAEQFCLRCKGARKGRNVPWCHVATRV